MRRIVQISCLLYFFIVFYPVKAQDKQDYLLLKGQETFSYVDKNGKTVIPEGKYKYCYTDTFRTYAIVLSHKQGWIGIDRNENTLYNVFVFDNGPDYPSDGLFRIVKNGQIGYANVESGKIIIQPQFEAAYPFEDGKAKVSIKAKTVSYGEYSKWENTDWFYIDKTGKRIIENIPQQDVSLFIRRWWNGMEMGAEYLTINKDGSAILYDDFQGNEIKMKWEYADGIITVSGDSEMGSTKYKLGTSDGKKTLVPLEANEFEAMRGWTYIEAN